MCAVPAIPLQGLGDAEQLLAQLEKLEAQLSQVREHLTRSHRLTTLGTLAATVAHEYHNILTPVVSYAQMAMADPDNIELTRKALQKALAGADRATRLSASVLGFSRLSDGSNCADLRQTVDEAVATLARDPRKDGIELRIDVPDGLYVAIDSLSLQQVLMNLMLNARKAMRCSGGHLFIQAQTLPARRRSSERVLIELRDSGPGIPPSVQRHLFEPFVTEPMPDEQSQGGQVESGTGLGLYICRDLITAAGGSIEVQSVAAPHADHGAAFRIELPRAEPPAEAPASAA